MAMNAAYQKFQRILTEAINDMVEHGFDSVERVERWTENLRAAAVEASIPTETLEQMLKDSLAATYKAEVENSRMLGRHPGVGRFTIQNVRPKLRAELDRRIMASANLIKLNRTETINKTVQRFQGWATSIPIGGTAEPERAATKKNIRKPLAQLPFEERRVLIDQSHKLTSALGEILATDGGAIAMRWRSHWRQPGYNYREDHKERDQKIYLLRSSWAKDKGLVKPGAVGYYDDITKVGEEVFCRCFAVWIYSLRDLPSDMLTEKGREALKQSKERIDLMTAAP